METAVAQKKESKKKSQPVTEELAAESSSLESELGSSAGMPLFLQRSPTSSIKLQNKQEDEDQDNDQVIQAKFTVSESNDNYEQEADRIAEQVVSAPELVTSMPSCPICGESASCPNCSTKVATQIQRSKSNSEDESVSLSPALLETNAGEPLDNSTREYMEHRFGQNFGSIRIHNSTTDVVAAEQINARAFTHKHHVYFGAGHFQPETIEGKRLIAHELTHTIQQSGTVSATADIQKDEDEQQSQRTPDQIAQEIYNALDGWNNEHRAINALHGHNEGTRNQIQERFQSAHNQSVRSYLREQLDADWLVKAYALLQSSNWYEQHTAMALALIPLDTRDEEVFRILYGLTLEGRQRLEERYNSTFGELGNGTEKIGEGSLKSDLKDDLSGWRKEKSLALLNRDLTQADELYFDSVAITGTHTDSVISRLQAQWSQGPTVLIQLEADWDRYVRNQANWTDETWTDMTLYQAMNDELSGESWELVRSILRGLERYTNEVGVIVGPLTEEQNRTVEDIQIQVARESLTAATTGGYTGAGTNNEQVYQAISTIQRIYQVRIDRAPDASTRERLQQEWNDYQRDHLMPIIHSEMDEDTVEYKRTVLLLLGALTPADEVYLAKVEYDTDRTVNLVTRIWAQGEINQMLTGAQQPRRDGDRIVRPSFDTLFLVPVTSGLPYRRIQALTREGAADVSRGIARLHLELMEGTSDSDLQQAYALLTTSGISATLRSSVISRYVANYLSNETGDSDVRKFIAYIQNRYERSHTTFEFQDLLDPAATATEMLTRAEGRYQSAHSGVLNLVLQDGVQGYDTLTGEDTEQVTQESLQRLRFIVQHTGVNQQELQAMMAIAGVTDVNQLARSEYETFRQRLNELRSVRQAIVDAVVTAAQLALETAATILTAGAAGPALLASLSATIAGMVARELLLGEDYELVSRENAQQIALVFASHGFGALGRSAFVMPAEATRAQAFFYGAAHEAVSQMSTQLVTASFEGRMPTAEGIGISAVSILTHSAGAGMRNQITHTIGEHATDAQRLRRLVIANIVQNVVSSNTDEAANLARGGIGDLTGADIAGRFLHSSASGIGRGVVGGIGELGAHVVDRRRQQSQQDAESTPPDQRLDDDMHDPTGLTAQGRQSDRPAAHAEPRVLAVHPVTVETRAAVFAEASEAHTAATGVVTEAPRPTETTEVPIRNFGARGEPIPRNRVDEFGTHTGPSSGRPYFPEEIGVPIRELSTEGVKITPKAINVVEQHLARFGADPANAAQTQRLRDIAAGKIQATQADLNFYTHELREYVRYRNLGYRTGLPPDSEAAHRLWSNTHTATLEDYGLKEGRGVLYDPSVEEIVDRLKPTGLPSGARGPSLPLLSPGSTDPLLVDVQAGTPFFLNSMVGTNLGSQGVAVEAGDWLIGYQGANPISPRDLAMSRLIVQNYPRWPATSGASIDDLLRLQPQNLPPETLDPATYLFPQTGSVTSLRGPNGLPQPFFPALGGAGRLIPLNQADVVGLQPTTHPPLYGRADQIYWRRPFALQRADAATQQSMGTELNQMLRLGGFVEFRILVAGDRRVVDVITQQIPGAEVVEVKQGMIRRFLADGTVPADPRQAEILRAAERDMRDEFDPLGKGTFNRIIRVYKRGQ